jgi:hypothetical protein
VETAKGKSIICKYESTFDGQKAYAELHKHHLKSTKASLSSVKILGYITSAKFGNGSWHCSMAENFIFRSKSASMSGLLHIVAISQMNRSLPCYKQQFIHDKNFIRSRLHPHYSKSIPKRTWTMMQILLFIVHCYRL